VIAQAAEPTTSELHEAATMLAELGYRVFPLVPRGKTPATTNGCKDATDDLDQIDRWWSDGTPYNVGVSTEGLFILDADTMNDGSPNPFVPSLNGHADDLDAAPCVATRSDGRHWWFRQTDSQAFRNSQGKIATKVDTRANGGYVVAPPSVFVPKCEDDGPAGQWRWLPGRDIEKPALLPTVPSWLIDRLNVAPAKAETPRTGDTLEKGSRNTTLFKMACRLRSGGFSQTAIDAALLAENVTTCNPPLPADEVHTIAASVMRYEPGEIPEEAGAPVEFQRITCRQLAEGDYRVEFYIDGMLVKGQPALMAGPPKGMKTSTLIDAATSLSTATRFLGRFDVPNAIRTGVMSGESGLATIQETARRIHDARGLKLEDNQNLIWSPDVPRFGDALHTAALEKFLRDDEIELLAVDPAYLSMPGADAGNLLIQGPLLRSMSKICGDMGVTLLICHHTKRNTLTPGGDPLELSDIAWAGFAEFARQWWLVNRRERYEEGTGEHRLWLSVGGSAGHSGLYAVNVSEGVYAPATPRWWDVSIENGNALLNQQRQEKKNAKATERDQKAEEKRDFDRTKVWAAMGELAKPETSSIIAGAARLNGTRTKAALGLLIADGLVREAKVVRENNQAYPGFELTEEGNAHA
jgi:hypothetical protein